METKSNISNFQLLSQDFRNDETVPKKFGCKRLGGKNISPEFHWINPPQGRQSYALIVDDEDSPCGKGEFACRHWSVFNIPTTIHSFKAGEDVTAISKVTERKNYTGGIGYAGPCPPYTHRYNFTIYALKDGMPYIPPGEALTRSIFQEEFYPYILGSSTLYGFFP